MKEKVFRGKLIELVAEASLMVSNNIKKSILYLKKEIELHEI